MAVTGEGFAYLAIPRTASRATENWLVAIGGEKRRFADGPENAISTHSRIPAEEADGRFLFTCVRHPFQRWVSAWRHWQGDRQPFGPWLEHVINTWKAGYPYGSDFCWRSQSEYLDLHPGIHTIRFEELPGALFDLPFVRGKDLPPYPEDNKGEHAEYTDDWRRHYGRRELMLALEHSGDDFERLGYPIL